MTARGALATVAARLVLATVALLATTGLLLPGAAIAAGPAAGSATSSHLEVFVRDGCPHCDDAKVFLDKLRREQSSLRITVSNVGTDRAALERFRGLAEAKGGGALSVPAFSANGQLLIGFSDEATSGARIRALLSGSPAEAAPAAAAAGTCPIGEDDASCAMPPPDAEEFFVDIPWTGKRITLDDVGLPAFTIAIGVLDGFNPCSMWVLVLMVSMLAAVGDRRRMIAIAGTFVAIQGIAYFAFMAAWLNLFLLIGLSRASEITLGVIALVAGLIHVKDFVAFGRGISLSIPESAKPGIYKRMRGLIHEQSLALAIGGTIVLGILVQFIELLCTSGLPALYTRILTLRQLDPWHYYGYILLYNVVYMIDDIALLTIGVVTLSTKRMQEKEGRILKLVSGLAMVGLGVYLIGMPR